MRALVVDDEPVMQRLIGRLLREDGWDVELAASGGEARLVFPQKAWDAVFVDFVLPDVDGVTLISEMRAKGINCPIIAVTGASSESVVEALLRAGAHDVVEKGRLDAPSLRKVLEAAVGPSPFPVRTLPRAPPEEDGDPLVAPAPGRALVVDDSRVSRTLAARLLQVEGWRVDEAQDAAEGMRRALAHDYDLLVLDYLLPDVDGIGLLHEMRRRGIETPAIVLSAHGDEAVATEFALAGAADLVPKEALNRARLIEAVARARLLRAPTRKA